MHVSPRPIRPAQHDTAPSRSEGSFLMLAFALYALLAMTGTILLARYVAGYTGTATQCGYILAACGLP